MNVKLKDVLDNLPALLKYLMVLGTIVLISFLFPEDLRFQYQFAENTIWKYDDFQAPDDFAIIKSQEELTSQMNEIKKGLTPIYTIDESIFSDTPSLLNSKVLALDTLKKEATLEESIVLKRLEQIYSTGIYHKSDTFNSDEITIINNGRIGNIKRTKLKSSSDAIDILNVEFGGLGLNFNEIVKANLLFNSEMTSKDVERKLNSVSRLKGKVAKGESIVRKGQIIDRKTFEKLETLRVNFEQNKSLGSKYWNVWFGYLLITALSIIIFILYLVKSSHEVFSNFAQFTFILFWILAFSYLVYYVENLGVVSIYILPFCVVPLVIKNFFGERIAFITFLFVILISSFLSTYGYEFTIIQILAGIVAIVTTSRTENWMLFFRSLIYIAITYLLAYFTLELIEKGDVTLLNWSAAAWLIISAFLNLLAYPFVPLFERLFGFTSNVRLKELSDLDNPLLKELALKAPGTFQHSLQVANLSESAAKKIGANAILLRTAALYHDVGKMKNPRFFVENSDGKNYHEELSSTESAKLIIGHVSEGILLAKKHKLPTVLLDFIRSHHGTTRVEYFYRLEVKNKGEQNVNPDDFIYPGKKPKTKEETILMIADSLEAASKSLSNPTWEDLTLLMNNIIKGKIQSYQLENSALSFNELESIKESFMHSLKSIYHGRIKYPETKDK